MGEDGVSLTYINLKHRVGQRFDYRALEFYYVVFCQNNFHPGRSDGSLRQMSSAIVSISGSPSVIAIVFS